MDVEPVAFQCRFRFRFWDGAPWGPWNTYDDPEERDAQARHMQSEKWLVESRDLYLGHGAGDAEEGSLRFIAKRNLRRMIETGSTETKTMLLCLEELS